jgi:hypothetical protein
MLHDQQVVRPMALWQTPSKIISMLHLNCICMQGSEHNMISKMCRTCSQGYIQDWLAAHLNDSKKWSSSSGCKEYLG